MRLTVNIEQYEHVRGFGQNAGMKVHLHSNVNLPNVNDQGFAVAPNSHAHASCKYSRVSFSYAIVNVIKPIFLNIE